MTRIVVPFGGMRLDRLAKKHMRTEGGGTVEALLSANPGLAASAIDGHIPAGIAIDTPEGYSPTAPAAPVLAWE